MSQKDYQSAANSKRWGKHLFTARTESNSSSEHMLSSGAVHSMQTNRTELNTSLCCELLFPTDWLMKLWFYVPLTTKSVILETFLPSHSLGLVRKKTKCNTRQKHAFTNQKKCTTTPNKHRKTKATFSRLLWHPAWKWNRSILKGKHK